MQICQILHVIFESTSQFSFKIFSVIKHNIIYIGQRSQLNSKFFRFSSARVKIHQIPHVMSFFIVMAHDSSVNFKLINFLLWTKGSHQIPILTLSSALVKFCQIPHVNFKTTSQFVSKFCITLQCHER